MTTKIPLCYPTAAILINACNEEITKEKMEALFKVANVPFMPRLAEYYCRSKEEMRQYLSFIGSSSSSSDVVEEKEEVVEEAPAEVEAAADVDVEFGDLFG